MIIYHRQNGSTTERSNSNKKIFNINSKKLYNNITLYKRKAHLNKKNDNYKSRTISINEDNCDNKIKLNIRKNSKGNYKERNIINDQHFKTNFKELIKNKKNNNKQPETFRYDINTKEKILSKFFKDTFENKNYMINNYQRDNKNDDIHNMIRTLSKKNKISRNNINKFKNNKRFNKSYIIKNNPKINSENELNYEFEISLLKKKQKELQKMNNKLKVKIFNIKNEQNRYLQKSEKEKIISKVIEIYKSYIDNKLDDLYISNDILSDKFPSKQYFKNMLLNIIDWIYDYENKLMKEQLFLALKSILNKDINNNIIKEINLLIQKKIDLNNSINEIKYYTEQEQNYQKYFSCLLKKFNFQNLEQLGKFLKGYFIGLNEETREIKRLNSMILQHYESNRKNTSSDKNYITNNEKLRVKRSSFRKNNSEININSKNINIDKDYALYRKNKGHSKENKLFYDHREFNTNNKKENSYIKEIVNISYLNKQNSYIFEKGNIEKNQNFNPRNISKNKIDIPNYLKSMTYNYIRNDK